jgi:hypothetical protein
MREEWLATFGHSSTYVLSSVGGVVRILRMLGRSHVILTFDLDLPIFQRNEHSAMYPTVLSRGRPLVA